MSFFQTCIYLRTPLLSSQPLSSFQDSTDLKSKDSVVEDIHDNGVARPVAPEPGETEGTTPEPQEMEQGPQEEQLKVGN